MKKGIQLALSLTAASAFLFYILAASLFFAPTGVTVHPARSSACEDARLDINTATAAELQSLSGIGDALSEAIVSWREENGPFLEKEDLLLVPGIGVKTYESLRDSIIVGGADEDSGRG